jgi:large subunit ribosomal protein L6
MSKIGKKPVPVPKGVTAAVEGANFRVKGPKGELTLALGDKVAAKIENDMVSVTSQGDSKQHKAAWGFTRAMVANLIRGVEKGYEKRLEINGVGYRAQAQGKQLQLTLGYSHDVVFAIPDGIAIATPKPTEIIITGIDKQKVGQVAAEIRGFRPPEPYKGKGIKYSNEYIFRKEGKKK